MNDTPDPALQRAGQILIFSVYTAPSGDSLTVKAWWIDRKTRKQSAGDEQSVGTLDVIRRVLQRSGFVEVGRSQNDPPNLVTNFL